MAVAIDPYTRAAAAYARAASPAAHPAAAAPTAAAGEQPSFATWLRQAAEDVVSQQQATEQQARQAVAGGADLTGVVTAVSEAELTLQTVIAVRDRVIEAYKDIMRMPV
jgi:flagellar hook-basal body complex protein FliE